MFASFRVTKLVGVLGIAAMFGMAGSAYAADDIASTAHNLSTSPEGICVYCHTPHNGTQAIAPLWNRTLVDAGTFTPYTNSKGDTNGAPAGVSLACLSCHDGSLTFGDIQHNPATAAEGQVTNVGKVTGDALLGLNLQNQHPISMSYPASGNFETSGVATAAGIKLFTGDVECASCHNPHEATLPKFLRITQADSSLCVACHTN